MKNLFITFLLLTSFSFFGQIDYSKSWQDFYSYNNVKDFVKVDDVIYALCDNAVFEYDTTTQEIKKFSSIQGLSGGSTSSIYYNRTFKRLVIGYQSGLLEIIDENGEISIASDLMNFNQNGSKSINHISEFNNKLYLSTPFAIIVYDIENLEFGDTYFIGNNSSDVHINQTLVINNTLYAATNSGLFSADVTSNLLIDFNVWQQSFENTPLYGITEFNNKIYTHNNTNLFLIDATTLVSKINFFETIKSIKSSTTHLVVSLNASVRVFDLALQEVINIENNDAFLFHVNTASINNNHVYVATQEYGVLDTTLNNTSNFTEIHPQGPLSNNVFSIAVKENHLWVVYGGYNNTYTPILKKQGFSHYNGTDWLNTPFDPNFPVIDLNYISIDPNHPNRVYISSFGDTRAVNDVSTGGLLVVENDEIKTFYNHLNSGLEDIVPTDPNRVTIRVSGTAFDRNGNLWVTNIGGNTELKKLNTDNQWSGVDLNSIKTNSAFGLNEVSVDNNNSIWIGTRRNGVYVYNENGSRKIALNTAVTRGALPDLNVRTVAIDNGNSAWIGTQSGLVVFNNAASVFDVNSPEQAAKPVVINVNDEGFGERLLGDQTVNTIAIDGADNKWFGTDNGGVVYTSPDGKTTLATFNTNNSPLPSNRILKIKVDEKSGKVYFTTDKGIVAYNSEVAPFGDVLGAVYAYPNPVLKNHQTVTIAGRNGTHLPKGTNVKIVDVSGYLVYETNVVEGEQLQGGKVVWNKKNLAGTPVASGIYIVLLSNNDATETTFAKIAIVN